MSIIEADGVRRAVVARRAGRAGLAACIALIAGLGIASHPPTASHAAPSAPSVSHTSIVTTSTDSVIGGPGSV